MNVGSIVFGPAVVKRDTIADSIRSFQGVTTNTVPHAHACNCRGPQPGETKCPCMLAAEMTKANAMICDVVTIGGVRYRLVPEV